MRDFLKGLALLALLVSAPALAAVDAGEYDAFWLWSGVSTQPVLAQAKTL